MKRWIVKLKHNDSTLVLKTIVYAQTRRLAKRLIEVQYPNFIVIEPPSEYTEK